MNERIQELWRDCVLKHTNNPMNWQTVADEFAELIIQECVQACINEGKTYALKSAGEYASNLYATAIRKHFGVEV